MYIFLSTEDTDSENIISQSVLCFREFLLIYCLGLVDTCILWTLNANPISIHSCSVWKRESSMKFGQEFRDHLFSSYAKFLEKYDHFLSPAYVHLRVRIRVGEICLLFGYFSLRTNGKLLKILTRSRTSCTDLLQAWDILRAFG